MATRSKATQAARPLDRIFGRGRIVDGAGIFQDRHFGKWPQCCPPKREYEGEEYRYRAKDPAMVFDVEWDGQHWDCKADGYGYMRSRGEDGEYGNGSIFVSAFDGVELVTPNPKLTCGNAVSVNVEQFVMNTWPGGDRHAMTQSEHEEWNACNYPGTRQLCSECDAETGRCEEDSIYLDDDCEVGPLCEECYEAMKDS